MSEHLENPSFAETKMDISTETTCQSQESPGITSPDNDGNTFHQKDFVPIFAYEGIKTADNTQELFSTVSKSQSYNKTGLTLASNHPLMSPGVTESDSENSHNHKPISKASSRFVFPDVVPATESQRHNKTTRTARPAMSSEKKVKSTLSTKPENFDIVDNPVGWRKSPALQDLSPDKMASSGSEQDLSQYHASVAPSFQSVALMTRPLFTSSNEQRDKLKCFTDALSDVSSVESFSNRSFDDDFNPNVISGSPTSSLFDNNIFREDNECALEEQLDYPKIAADSTHMKQKIILPDGKTREIDMKVIEPYKRVLSHGGYLKAAGHNAIIIFSACYLPDRSRRDYHYVMDSLFLYVVQTLEQLVTDDYIMIYLHGGSCHNNVPPFNWLRKCYQLLDRRLRKSLKTLYMVHPTFWLKSLVLMSRPFISSKFWRKLIYIKNLEDLYTKVPVEKAAIPEKVKQYNSKCVKK